MGLLEKIDSRKKRIIRMLAGFVIGIITGLLYGLGGSTNLFAFLGILIILIVVQYIFIRRKTIFKWQERILLLTLIFTGIIIGNVLVERELININVSGPTIGFLIFGFFSTILIVFGVLNRRNKYSRHK